MIKSVTVNGKAINVGLSYEVALMYNDLPWEAKIEITTVGRWPKESSTGV